MNLPKINKTFIGLAVTIILSLSLVGCGNTASQSTSSPTDQISDNINTDNNTENNIAADNVEEYIQDVDSDHSFRNSYHGIEITGIEEFENLKSDLYEDIPSDGKVFVVMYIDLVNFNDTPYYFSPDYCTFLVDGELVTNTFLVNEPKEDYETIFGKVYRGATGLYYDRRGFLVIEAPKDWQTLDFSYTGWAFDGEGNCIVTNKFTRADLEKSE